MFRNINRQKKIDEAVSAHVHKLITLGGHKEEALLGTELHDLRIRFGDEGPNAYTSCSNITIEQRHIDGARNLDA